MLGETCAQGTRQSVVDFESLASKVVGESAHRGDHEMGSLDVPFLRTDLGLTLDHENAMGLGCGIGETREIEVQLVAENPDSRSGCGAHAVNLGVVPQGVMRPMTARLAHGPMSEMIECRSREGVDR